MELREEAGGQNPYMRILVCVKANPDFDQIVDEDWDSFSLSTDLSYVKRSFGCFDETALETALRLRDSFETTGVRAKCGVLSLCPLPAPLYRNLFALGFDSVFAAPFIPGNTAHGERMEFRPAETAAALGKCAGGGNWDLILAGRQAGYADTGMVPLLLAEYLSLPVITEVEFISPGGEVPAGAADGENAAPCIVVERAGAAGRERLRVGLPALAVMGNSPVSALRAATLAAQMRAARRSPEPPGMAGGGMDSVTEASPAAALSLTRKKIRKTCRFLSGGAGLSQSVNEITALLEQWRER
jgi:electron transfer flavoprotein beta subunit